MSREREWTAGVALALVGVGVRLAFLRRFPTLPFSDFRALIDFGLRFRDAGFVERSWHWVQFNPGLPLILSVLFRIFPRDPVAAARTATAVATGMAPLLPFLIWRGVVSFRWRLLAGLLLALWLGQVFFSGVVAQDNWVLLPAVALAALGARHLLDPFDPGYPVAAGLLFATAVAIRQEMIIVLFPPLIAASGVFRETDGRFRRVALLAASAGIPILLLCGQRAAATGRFTVVTQHGGLGLLGSAVPGAAAPGWTNPAAYVASIDPDLVKNPEGLRKQSYRLAVSELKRRWRFHTFRIGVAALRLAVDSDADDLFWSVGAAEALPPSARDRGTALFERAALWLRGELALIQGLFLSAFAVGIRRRDRAILILVSAVVLKFGIQAPISPMGRMIVPATALELLAIPMAASLVASERAWRFGVAVLLGGLGASGALLIATPRLTELVARKDEAPRTVRRFPLAILGGGWVDCGMKSGALLSLDESRATIAFRNADPAPGETVRAICHLPAPEAGEGLVLRLEDPYARGGLPDRIVERVEVNGRELLRHDIARDPGAGWLEIRLPSDAPAEVLVEVLAIHPDPGWQWGRAATVRFEFRRRQRSEPRP